MYKMIRLEKINADNYQKVFDLELVGEQENFVSSNMRSLAQAWVFYERAKPYAIYNDDTIVGFIMFDYKIENRKVEIWRFMLGSAYQGKGYGKEALNKAIEFLKQENLFDYIQINYVEENLVAKKLYQKVGFSETGEMEGNEVVMRLSIVKE
ncbi:Acetyltransferase [Bacillus cereus AH1273]|jgi:diamine N-acetyltransferase|nr:Acetyltransferase [Bacillus cereus AH1273]